MLLANAALAGLLAARFSPAGTRRVAGACALGLCLLLDFGLEGLIGATEPVATLPVLLGLWAWGGEPLRGRAGWWRALALGLALGLAVFVKQQAGLLALAWLGLLPDWRARRHEPGPLLAIPAAASALLLLLLWRSGGLGALARGLDTARGYGVGADGAVGSSLPVVLSLVAALAAAALLPLALRALAGEAWARGAAFALAAGVAALGQLIVRDYRHYALLGLPLLCVAGVALIAQGLVRAGALQRGRELFAPLAAVQGALALAVALVPAEARSPSAFPQVPATEWPASRAAAADLEELRRQVAPGSQLVLLPPRRAAVHFLLGTRADRWPTGYFWGPPERGLALRVVRDPKVDAVLQVAPADGSDEVNVADFGVPEALAALPALGYVPVFRGRDLVLWRR